MEEMFPKVRETRWGDEASVGMERMQQFYSLLNILIDASVTTLAIATRDGSHGLWGLSDHTVVGSLRYLDISVFLTEVDEGTEPPFQWKQSSFRITVSKHSRKFFCDSKSSSSPTIQAFLSHKNDVSHIRTMNKPARTKAKLSAPPLGSNQHLLLGSTYSWECPISVQMWQASNRCCSAGFPALSPRSLSVW